MQNKAPYFFRLKIISRICFAFFKTSFSQPDSIQYATTKHFLSVEDGLASREVFCAIQDNNGFMWFGTRNGVNRYDAKILSFLPNKKMAWQKTK